MQHVPINDKMIKSTLRLLDPRPRANDKHLYLPIAISSPQDTNIPQRWHGVQAICDPTADRHFVSRDFVQRVMGITTTGVDSRFIRLIWENLGSKAESTNYSQYEMIFWFKIGLRSNVIFSISHGTYAEYTNQPFEGTLSSPMKESHFQIRLLYMNRGDGNREPLSSIAVEAVHNQELLLQPRGETLTTRLQHAEERSIYSHYSYAQSGYAHSGSTIRSYVAGDFENPDFLLQPDVESLPPALQIFGGQFAYRYYSYDKNNHAHSGSTPQNLVTGPIGSYQLAPQLEPQPPRPPPASPRLRTPSPEDTVLIRDSRGNSYHVKRKPPKIDPGEDYWTWPAR